MKRWKFSQEQVAYALRQAETETTAGDVFRQLGLGEATFYVWKKRSTSSILAQRCRMPTSSPSTGACATSP